MKIELITKALENKGYKVSAKTVEKNGLVKDAILVHLNDGIAATIYTDMLESFEGTPESIADKIIAMSVQNAPTVSKDKLEQAIRDRDFLRKNLFVRLEKSPSDEYASKKSIFPGTSEILSLRVDSLVGGSASCKVTKSVLNSLPMTEEEAWSYAKENIEKDVVVESMCKTLSMMMDIPEEFLEQSYPVKMYVVTNNGKCGGASAILTETARKELRNIFGDGALIVIPSSIHECLVFKRDDDNVPDEDEVLDMVATVNRDEVAPEERLSDGIFIME